jgi:cytochrome b pre-mRNA-processing protein 3
MGEPRQPSGAGGLPTWRVRLQAGREARRAQATAAGRLYAEVVGEARSARWFAELGVPDTPEGRFEMIGLHAGLVLRRLRTEGPAGAALAQALFDLMFADMDAALRELGVGDLSVGKQVKRLAGQFYARLAGLDAVLGGGDSAVLAPVWQGGAPPAPAQIATLAEHLRALERQLGEVPGSALLRGEARFGATAS